MDSRDKILESIPKNEKALGPLPDFDFEKAGVEPIDRFKEVLVSIGGSVIDVESQEAILAIASQVAGERSLVSYTDDFGGMQGVRDGHEFQSTEVAVIQGEFGVAENGAIWLSESSVPHRSLPFICQHLILVISRNQIVRDMHEAYNRIGDSLYGFGIFIAGPSKTADIEQSLVLGAHGPKTLLVCLLNKP